MLNSQILEVAIGLIFVYLLFSLICSMLQEWFARYFQQLRAKMLLDGIHSMLNDPSMLYDFYRHPLINSLAKLDAERLSEKLPKPPENLQDATTEQRKTLGIPDNAKPEDLGDILKSNLKPILEKTLDQQPSYIPARTFATVLLDLVARTPENATEPLSLSSIRAAASKSDWFRKTLLPLLDATQNDLEKAYKNVEKWFDDTMDRVSGWYKRHTKWWLWIFAVLVCLAMNVDTFAIANSLYRNDTLRASVVAAAQKQTKEEKKATGTVQEAIKQVQDLNLPIGWVWESQIENDPRSFKGRDEWGWLVKIIGLFFSIMAVSLGAPFWFDLLNKLVNLRGTGNTPAPAAANPKPQ